MKENNYGFLIEEALKNAVECKSEECTGLKAAMDYSLLSGGKRIRPKLVLEFCRVSGGDIHACIPVALAVEMIHTYSLIHDDLPCMDDDSLRRGRPANHIVFGECNATLAGDALQAYAFETMLRSDLPAERLVECAYNLASSSGLNGMCGGQYLDMKYEGVYLSEAELNNINRLKTGCLLDCSCVMGVIAAGGSPDMLNAAKVFGYHLGLAFQIRDDILDIIGSEELLGKNIGSDICSGKNTYVKLLGVEKCTSLVQEHTKKAKEALFGVFNDTEHLCSLADALINRLN